MKKRATAVILIFCLLTSGLGLRLFYISKPDSIYASDIQSKKEVSLAEYRGMIYDRRKRPLVYNKNVYNVLVKPSLSALPKIKDLNETHLFKDNTEKGNLTVIKTEKYPGIETDENITTVKTKKRYDNSFLCHILGYTDFENNGVCGVEKVCNGVLSEYKGGISVIYDTDALGRMLLGTDTEIREINSDDKSGIMLTIDRDIQIITETALKNSGIQKGAAIVLNAENFEILACASVPNFDLNSPEKSINDENSPFINRAFTPFSVGSVFKVITAASYLENGGKSDGFIYNCKGKITKDGNTFLCSNKDGHKKADLKKALTYSCNTYFIELATKIGSEKLLETAKKFGLSKSFDLGFGFMTDTGYLPSESELNSDAAVGNLGFGQGSLLSSPLQIAVCYAVLGNGGEIAEPTLIKCKIDKDGQKYDERKLSKERILSEYTCKTISDCLLNAVNCGTGTNAKSDTVNICGKTATAETGKTDENGLPILDTWFCGFFPCENPEYVICVLKENGASGSSDDAPVFKEIAENIIKIR